MIPSVANYGSVEQEPFDSYIRRWPDQLGNFPRCVVENWVYRHCPQFKASWECRSPQDFVFRLESFSNDKILQIGHVRDSLKTADHWGQQLFTHEFRRKSWLGAFMLAEGTTPTPIIVSDNAGGLEHPGGGQMAPLQLLEGHLRLSYLRGMIHKAHPSLKDKHQVWVASLPNQEFKPAERK